MVQRLVDPLHLLVAGTSKHGCRFTARTGFTVESHQGAEEEERKAVETELCINVT